MSQFKKVLLMGKAGCGKTSMRSIIFGDYVARDTARLGPTIEIDSSTANFLDDLILNILDCGGNESFMEEYFASQRDNIFSDVEILIYVFDVESSGEVLDKEINYYKSCLEAIQQKSPEAKIFCLIHKMDLVREKEQRDVLFQAKEEDLKRLSQPLELECTCFWSSIWDETLYKAWSSIICSLVHNARELEDSLTQFANVIEADEVLLFERHTFLLVSHAERKKRRDPHRFEKFANIVKKFKLTCSKHVDGQIQKMEVRNSQFVAFVDEFTRNTYVLIITSDCSLTSAAMAVNIKNARKYFENY